HPANSSAATATLNALSAKTRADAVASVRMTVGSITAGVMLVALQPDTLQAFHDVFNIKHKQL
ncbi:MAG TPA: hypothetical protein VG099_02560, partial [Gemmataceae bacterium]|nr:hypothetical protein [Gemmataceae bacterium]